VSGLWFTALAVAFPFSLINPISYTGFDSQINQLPHKLTYEGKDPQHWSTAFTLAHTFLRPHKGTSLLYQGQYDLNSKSTGAGLRWVSGTLLSAPAWGNPCWGSTKSRLPCTVPHVFFFSYLPEALSHHAIKPTAPSQLWPYCDSSSRGAFAPSLWAETEPGVYLHTPYVMLEETWLILVPDDFSSVPTCQIPLLPEAVTQEWRFYVADSVLVPLNGSVLKAHLIVNPSGMCLACCLQALPSPSCAYWDPGLLWKTHTMVSCLS
jgi:hypothetical protein